MRAAMLARVVLPGSGARQCSPLGARCPSRPRPVQQPSWPQRAAAAAGDSGAVSTSGNDAMPPASRPAALMRQLRRRLGREKDESLPPGSDTAAAKIIGVLLRTPTPPIGSYIPEPPTLLHGLDPRVKQAWLLVLVFLPLRAALPVRIGLGAALAAAALALFPARVARPQLRQLGALCGLLLLLTSLGADSIRPLVSARLPPPGWEGLPASLPPPSAPYTYTLLSLGPLTVTRRGVLLGASAASATFCILQATWLLQASTAPEAVAASLRWLLQPASVLGGAAARAATEEAVLALLLAVRFTGLVYEEARNLALGVASRSVRWDKLAWGGTMQTTALLAGQLLSNLFARAEQIAAAMRARGYGAAEPPAFRLYLLEPLRLRWGDAAALVALVALVGLAIACPQL